MCWLSKPHGRQVLLGIAAWFVASSLGACLVMLAR